MRILMPILMPILTTRSAFAWPSSVILLFSNPTHILHDPPPNRKPFPRFSVVNSNHFRCHHSRPIGPFCQFSLLLGQPSTFMPATIYSNALFLHIFCMITPLPFAAILIHNQPTTPFPRFSAENSKKFPMPSFAAYWAILPILLVVWPAKHIHARPPTYGDEHPGDGEHPMIAPTFDDGEKPAFTFPFIEEPAGSLMQASHGNETVAALMPAAYTVATYPNPQGGSPDDHWACHVDRRGSLCDPDSLLEKAERSELQELITHFPEWTQQANSDNKCVQKGIQLGIALADLPILMNGQSGKGRQHFANSTHRRWLEGVDDLEAKNLFNAAWERMDQLADFHMDPKDKVGERIAKDWKLLAGHAGCNRALLILATAEPRGVHVYAHPSVPILMEERVAIVAGEGDAIARSEYAPALRAIITNLRQVILHRQQMFSGKKATAFAPIPIIWSILVVLAIVASFSALILALAIYIRIRPKIVAIVQMRDVMDGGMGGM